MCYTKSTKDLKASKVDAMKIKAADKDEKSGKGGNQLLLETIASAGVAGKIKCAV